MENEQTPEIETDNKTEKKFVETMKKLTAVVGGKSNLRIPSKVPKDVMGSIITELFKEENDQLIETVKNELKSLLKTYAEMEKAFKVKEEELVKLKKSKKEEFVKACSALFNKVDNIGDIESAYYDGLKTATTEG